MPRIDIVDVLVFFIGAGSSHMPHCISCPPGLVTFGGCCIAQRLLYAPRLLADASRFSGVLSEILMVPNIRSLPERVGPSI